MSRAFQFFSPEVQQDPYPFYTRSRAEEPVFFCEDLGMWVATRYADVTAILLDTARFSSRLTTVSVKPPPPEVLAVLRKGLPRTGAIIHLDPPEHTAVRRMMNAAFTADRIARKEGAITAVAHRLVDGFAADGRADLVKQFCNLLPVAVIADILGVPESAASQFGQWADDFARLLMSGALPTEEWVKAAESMVAMQRCLADLITARRSKPADDLLTTLIQSATDPAGELDMTKAVTYATTFISAGHKTTTDLIGNAMRLLLQHPEQLAALVRDPSLAAAAVEETLRRDCPVPGTARVAKEEVKIGGVTIPKDGRILVLLGSANHDEGVFGEPEPFDLARAATVKGEHVAFGRGVHFCLGAPLARLEGRVALVALTQRLQSLRPADEGPVKFRQVTMFRGPVSLDVTWDAAPAWTLAPA